MLRCAYAYCIVGLISAFAVSAGQQEPTTSPAAPTTRTNELLVECGSPPQENDPFRFAYHLVQAQSDTIALELIVKEEVLQRHCIPYEGGLDQLVRDMSMGLARAAHNYVPVKREWPGPLWQVSTSTQCGPLTVGSFLEGNSADIEDFIRGDSASKRAFAALSRRTPKAYCIVDVFDPKGQYLVTSRPIELLPPPSPIAQASEMTVESVGDPLGKKRFCFTYRVKHAESNVIAFELLEGEKLFVQGCFAYQGGFDEFVRDVSVGLAKAADDYVPLKRERPGPDWRMTISVRHGPVTQRVILDGKSEDVHDFLRANPSSERAFVVLSAGRGKGHRILFGPPGPYSDVGLPATPPPQPAK